MITPDCTLDQLQRWLLNAIARSDTVEPGFLERTILPSRQQSAEERLAVYSHAYVARLLEVLRELFPCTRFAVGEELFDQFAAGYLQAHPPHSYTLARLADKLTDYLDATRPADWGRFIVELIGLEQAIDRIFDGCGPEGLLTFILPENADESLKLSLVSGFELHAFSHPVSNYYTDWKAGREPRWPQPAEQFLALFRRDYVVRRFELTRTQYELLVMLSRGQTLGEAVISIADAVDQSSAEQLADEIRGWFGLWAAAGFFATAV